jgi:hypothetical protein
MNENLFLAPRNPREVCESSASKWKIDRSHNAN